MTPKQQAEKIFTYMNLDFIASEGAICLLYQHCEDKEYWEEVWYELLLKYGERWQSMQWDDELSKQHYIEQVCP